MSTQHASIALSNFATWQERFPFMEMMCRHSKTICPFLEFNFSGLDPNGKYEVSLSIQRFDNIRYGFSSEEKIWKQSTRRKFVPESQHKFYKHPNGEMTGAELMETSLIFKDVRITNEKKSVTSDRIFFLNPMHKYVPVIVISNVFNAIDQKRVQFDVAQFIAVTTYQQKDMGPWKSMKSKFATRKNKELAATVAISHPSGPAASSEYSSEPASPVLPDYSPEVTTSQWDYSHSPNQLYSNQYSQYTQFYENMNFQFSSNPYEVISDPSHVDQSYFESSQYPIQSQSYQFTPYSIPDLQYSSNSSPSNSFFSSDSYSSSPSFSNFNQFQ